jgi:hypothetical protein
MREGFRPFLFSYIGKNGKISPFAVGIMGGSK